MPFRLPPRLSGEHDIIVGSSPYRQAFYPPKTLAAGWMWPFRAPSQCKGLHPCQKERSEALARRLRVSAPWSEEGWAAQILPLAR